MHTITVVSWASHQQHCITSFASLLFPFSFHPSLFSPLTQLFCRKIRLFEEGKNLSLLNSREREGDDREKITAPLSSHTSTNDNCVWLITESCYNRCGTLHLGKNVFLVLGCVYKRDKKSVVCVAVAFWVKVCMTLCLSVVEIIVNGVCHMLTKAYMLLNVLRHWSPYCVIDYNVRQSV